MKKHIAIIGAGIVGLATARFLRKKYPGAQITVLEKEPAPALHQTGRNSGVLHSGIYYKPGSLKSKNCLAGYRMMLDFAEAEKIPYKISGKLILATRKEQLPGLERLYKNGKKAGLKGLIKLDKSGIKEYEPYVRGVAGLFVPQTGVIDFGKVAESLYLLLENEGVVFHFHTEAVQILPGDRPVILTNKGKLEADYVVVCAGLYADRFKDAGYRIIPFRGEYYRLPERIAQKVRSLVYPVPDERFPFLGVHLTRHINGEVTAGPNAVLALGREAYVKTGFNWHDSVKTFTWPGFWKLAFKYGRYGAAEMLRSFSKKRFAASVREMLPDMEVSDLLPHRPGIRAQTVDRKGHLADDFILEQDGRILYVLNAPSPAATASLAIGKYIAEKIRL